MLAAIARIETVVRDSRDREAYQSVRGDLLEMTRTIAVTRAEVAESKPERRAESKPAGERKAPEGSDPIAVAPAPADNTVEPAAEAANGGSTSADYGPVAGRSGRTAPSPPRR